MDIDGLLIATDRRVVVAHSLKKVAPAEDTPWLLRKESPDFKLGWSEEKFPPPCQLRKQLETPNLLLCAESSLLPVLRDLHLLEFDQHLQPMKHLLRSQQE